MLCCAAVYLCYTEVVLTFDSLDDSLKFLKGAVLWATIFGQNSQNLNFEHCVD